MEGMVTDLQLAREKQGMFDEWLKRRPRALPLDLSVTVLTTGFWPTYKALDLALPAELVRRGCFVGCLLLVFVRCVSGGRPVSSNLY